MPAKVYLVRHGETEWTITGQHTGLTDIPLTENGRDEAKVLRRALARHRFSRVLSSPLSRALETCRLAGLGDRVETHDDLMEWDYGEYEGKTTVEIRHQRPRWSLWLDGAPGGESAADVGSRADRVIRDIRRNDPGTDAGADGASGDVAIFAHGHLLRVLAARWVGLAAGDGRAFALDPATVSVLWYERATPVLYVWNDHPIERTAARRSSAARTER